MSEEYVTLFEETAEGVKITLAVDKEEADKRNFNLGFALKELANQLVAQAEKLSKGK